MTYKEFKKLMEDNGFEVDVSKDRVIVHNREGDICGWVSNTEPETLDTTWDYYHDLPKKLRRFVGQKCFELAFTDLKDREDEEKYYYILKGISGNRTFLIKFRDIDALDIGTYADAVSEQSSFTNSEFKALPDDVKSHNWGKIKVGDA